MSNRNAILFSFVQQQVTMAKILSCLLICLAFVQPVRAETPVWGVFHSIHSKLSDGTESLTQRTDNLRMYYNFASTVDHDRMLTGSEWLQTITEVSAYQSLSEFVYFAGYEWLGTGTNYTEITAFFAGDPPSVIANGNDSNYDTFSEFAVWLSQNKGIGCINHPTLYSDINWSDPGVKNEQIFPCVEILNRSYYQWSDQWVCAEGSGCNTYNNPSPAPSAHWLSSVRNALDRGLRLGFVAGWDYHEGYPGTPTAYIGLVGVTEWTKEAIVDAVRSRHTWAAEDKILMNVRSGSHTMGDAFFASGEVVPIDYDILAAPGKTITEISIFTDGIITEVHRYSGQQRAVGSFEMELSVTEHYIFLEAIQSDGKRAWSSPMFINVPGPCINAMTWEGRVGGYSDDAEEALNGGVLYLDSSDLELINDSDWRGEQIVGIRFNGVDIPKGVTVLNAYIQFKVDETSSEATSLRIAGEDVDHPAPFTTSTGNVSSRVRTSAEVAWAPAAWTTVGESSLNQRTPALSSIIDEIINRPGWTPGNSMAFLITGTGKRVAVAYDGDRYGAPLLHVEYGTECSGNNPLPSTTTLSPASAIAGGSGFTLSVNGTGFVSSSVVRWNGANRTTTFVSSTELTAAIPASDIAVAGTAQVTVFNPAPAGGTSNAHTFAIAAVNSPPVALNDAYYTDENTTLRVAAPGVLENDRDSEGGPLSANLVHAPSNGTLELSADGRFTYTPNIGFSGTDSFAYVANDGAASSNTATVSIVVRAYQVPQSMHVGDLDGRSENIQKNKWVATVIITVHESTENPAANATVSGRWSGGYSGVSSCITGVSGQCAVRTAQIPNPKATVTFTINNITHATLSYNSSDNHEPENDSNGTSIAVSKPQ